MDIVSLTTAMNSLKLAKDAVNAALSVRDFNAVATTLSGVNDQLLKAQDGLFIYSARLSELQEELSRAKDELRELKRVQAEHDKYTLFQISDGVFVYKSKAVPETIEGGSGSVEPGHYVCQRCFDQRPPIKVVLQQSGIYGQITIDCSNCGGKYATGVEGKSRDMFIAGPRSSWYDY